VWQIGALLETEGKAPLLLVLVTSQTDTIPQAGLKGPAETATVAVSGPY
jgi:hypothetical protein